MRGVVNKYIERQDGGIKRNPADIMYAGASEGIRVSWELQIRELSQRRVSIACCCFHRRYKYIERRDGGIKSNPADIMMYAGASEGIRVSWELQIGELSLERSMY